MKKTSSFKHIVAEDKKGFNPSRLVSNDEYCKNLNAIIAYYQISKGETKKRFVSSSEPWNDQELVAS
ncbi:MAG: hypothetical protein JSV25_01540 [Spirochaetota bacterium]|nr:MAG: hypothetical protein JSV25_01540 [Spirochaetota bacterium]